MNASQRPQNRIERPIAGTKDHRLGRWSKLEMVLIPAGSFAMGDDSGLDDEKPVHKVAITKPFYLGTARGDDWAVPPVC